MADCSVPSGSRLQLVEWLTSLRPPYGGGLFELNKVFPERRLCWVLEISKFGVITDHHLIVVVLNIARPADFFHAEAGSGDCRYHAQRDCGSKNLA